MTAGGGSRTMSATRFPWVTMALALASGIAAVAGQVSEVHAALTYDFTLGAGAQLNDNLYLDPSQPGEVGGRQPVEETVFTLAPGATVLWREPHDQVRLRYQGEYWMFQGDEKRDPLWVNNLAADLEWRRWAPFFLEAADVLDRIPRTQQSEGVAVVDQIDRNHASLRSGLVWDLRSRGTMELAYRGEFVTFPGAEAVDTVSKHQGDGRIRYRWSPLVSSDVRMAYGRVSHELSADYTELSASAAVDQRVSEHLALAFRLEWIRDDEDKQAATDTTSGASASSIRSNLLLAAEARGVLPTAGSWKIAYEDRREDRPDGDTLDVGRFSGSLRLNARLGSSLDAGMWYEDRSYQDSGRQEKAWGPTLTSRWMINSWAACDLGVDWTNTTVEDEGLPAIENNLTRASVGFVVLMFRHLQLEAGYRYQHNASSDAVKSYKNNLLYAAATYSFELIPPGRLLPSRISQVPVSGEAGSTATSNSTGSQSVGGGKAVGH